MSTPAAIDRNATEARRLAVARALVLLAAGLAALAAVATPPGAMIAVLSALSLAAATLFPALVLGIWWRRANTWGAVAGMAVGLAVCAYYLIGTRYMPVGFYETWPHLSNASDAAIRKFVSLKAAWESAAAGDGKDRGLGSARDPCPRNRGQGRARQLVRRPRRRLRALCAAGWPSRHDPCESPHAAPRAAYPGRVLEVIGVNTPLTAR